MDEFHKTEKHQNKMTWMKIPLGQKTEVDY